MWPGVSRYRVRFLRRPRLYTLCDSPKHSVFSTWSRETDGSIESGDRVKPSNAGTGTTRTPSLTSDQEAIALFKAFHARNSPYFLGPGRFVLLGEDHTWSRALVPFWVCIMQTALRVQGDKRNAISLSFIVRSSGLQGFVPISVQISRRFRLVP